MIAGGFNSVSLLQIATHSHCVLFDMQVCADIPEFPVLLSALLRARGILKLGM